MPCRPRRKTHDEHTHYLRWRGDLTAAQTPFNEVDALILQNWPTYL